MSTRRFFPLVTTLTLALLSACGGVHSSVGFRLPENGDVERGRAAFIDLKCYTCHTVNGVETPEPAGDTLVALGGAVTEVRTDGYLVASIIHPSHKIKARPKEAVTVEGVSRMPDFTRSMTVRQLIDIVAMLQSRYRYMPPPTPY